MNNIDLRDYIAACELADGFVPLAQMTPNVAYASRAADVPDDPANTEDEAPTGAVVAGTLVAFAEGVSRQNREDVLDSFLFATLVANKAFSPKTQSELWYGKFNEVISTIGWLATNWRYAQYRATQQRFTMDEVGLEILASAVAAAALPGPASAAMLTVAKDAVAALRAKEEPLRLFERQTRTYRGGDFRMATCAQSEDGTVNLAMGAVSFKTDRDVTDVLFWQWQDSEVDTWLGENSLILNTRLYARNRELIQDKLGSNAKSAIEKFNL
jgi:hypothetical protein